MSKRSKRGPIADTVCWGLGRAYELGGKIQQAKQAYERALAAWHHADEDLPQLAEIRERLAGFAE